MSAARRGARAAARVPEQTLVTRENVRVGLSVVRGPDFQWENQDGGAGLVGTVVALHGFAPSTRDWCAVSWAVSGHLNSYRVGTGGRFDLAVAADEAVTRDGVVVCVANAVLGMRVRAAAGLGGRQACHDAGGAACAGTVVSVEAVPAEAPPAAAAPAPPPARASRRRTRAEMEAAGAAAAAPPAPAVDPSAPVRCIVRWDAGAPGTVCAYMLPPAAMQSRQRFQLRTLPAAEEAAAGAAAAAVRAAAAVQPAVAPSPPPPPPAPRFFTGRVVTLAEAVPGLRVVRGEPLPQPLPTASRFRV